MKVAFDSKSDFSEKIPLKFPKFSNNFMEKFKKIVFLSNISDCKIDFIKNVLKWTEFLVQNFQQFSRVFLKETI